MSEDEEREEPETEEESSAPRFVSTQYLGDGRCPLRGHPHRYPLDGRCPQTLYCIMVQTRVAVTKGGTQGVLTPIPVVQDESHCQSCLNDNVRENEAGLKIKPRVIHTGGVLRGRLKIKTPTADKREKRQARNKLAERFMRGSTGGKD